MKYLYILLLGVFFINCSDKTTELKRANEVSTNIPQAVITETVTVTPVTVAPMPIKKGAVEIVESASIDDETLVVDEKKITKNIKSDVPTKCMMWSDGCNVCTRSNSREASCTTYPECHNRVLSCLKWN